MANGFVYVITSGDGMVKVGVSKNPSQRLKQIQTSNIGADIKFTSIEVGNSYEVEKRVHKELSSHFVSGEWFSCGEDKAVSSVIKNIEEHGVNPKPVDDSSRNTEAEVKMQEWKMLGCSLDSASMLNYEIVKSYLEIDKSVEFSSLSHGEQYLIACTNLAKAFINAHMNDDYKG